MIVHGRDYRKVDAVLGDLEGDHHEGAIADFSSLEAVRGMAAHITEQFGRLDVLVNNAGIYPVERLTTENGHELTFQVNHLSPYLLTHLLLPLLKAGAPARVITVASGAHAKGAIVFGDLMHDNDFEPFGAYADSKLANVMFAYALARKVEGTGVTSVCMDPGATDTKMLHAAHPDYEGRAADDAGRELAELCLSKTFGHSNGIYFRDGAPHRSSRASHDEEVQERLWQVSARLVGLKRW